MFEKRPARHKLRAYSDTYKTDSELPVIVTYSIIDGEIEIESVEIDQSQIKQDDLQDWYAEEILDDLRGKREDQQVNAELARLEDERNGW